MRFTDVVALAARVMEAGGIVVMLWGVIGVMFATPLPACFLRLVRELYVGGLEERAQLG